MGAWSQFWSQLSRDADICCLRNPVRLRLMPLTTEPSDAFATNR